MLYSRLLRYKNEIITKFSSYSKQLVNNISKFHETSQNDQFIVLKDINDNVNNFLEASKEIKLRIRFFSTLNLIESLVIAGNFFSYKSKLHINRTLKPILSESLLSKFSNNLYYFRWDIISHLLGLYNNNLISLDEKYYMLCSFSKSWDLVPIQTWNSLFESFINELHLHSPIQIANILLIHHRIHHLIRKQIPQNFITQDHKITHFKSQNETNSTKISDCTMLNNDYIHSLGLMLLSKDIQQLKPNKIIEIVYLATRRNSKSINFYNTVHRHLMALNNLTFGNYTTLVRLNTHVLQLCLSVFGNEKHLLQELNDIIRIFSNILECVERYNDRIISIKPIKELLDSNGLYHDIEPINQGYKISRPKYHSILILDALCSKTILKSISLLDKHYTHFNVNIIKLLQKYHISINKLIKISSYDINNIQCNGLYSTLRISGSMYSKFFNAGEISCTNKEIGNVVSANLENHSSLIAHLRSNTHIK